MVRLEYNAFKSDSKNASSKAKKDISSILHRLGYNDLYQPSNKRMIRIVQQIKALFFIPKDSCLVVQYPSHLPFFYNLLFSLKKKCKKIAVVHDVESLRGAMDIKKEIGILNGFDVIICHNNTMRDYLISKGLKRTIFEIQVFDYLLDRCVKTNQNFEKFSVFFAGNLVKSTFLQKLWQLKGVHFNIYGAYFEGIEKIKNQVNVIYKGAFSPEELIPNIVGGWGLVWDGESLDTCSGLSGEYLKYNNPHKVSMCIVSERPIIIWSQSAMAPYIKEKGIGICVDSLLDIQSTIDSISDADYIEMLKRVKKEKTRLIEGKNFIESLEKCEKLLGIRKPILSKNT